MYEKVIRSGNLLEYWKYTGTPLNLHGKIKRKTQKESGRTGYRRGTVRRADNIRNATRNFRRLVRANLVGKENPALLTLTMLQELSLKASSRLFTQFSIRLRISFPKIKYIAVPEFQKRGAVHYHVLIWNLPKEQIQTEGQSRTLQRIWCRGFVDCIETDGSVKLAGYLSKYMSKSMSDVRLGGEKAYHASRNVLRPMSAGASAFSDEVKEELGINLQTFAVHKFKTRYLGECTYQAYDIQDIDNNTA